MSAGGGNVRVALLASAWLACAALSSPHRAIAQQPAAAHDEVRAWLREHSLPSEAGELDGASDLGALDAAWARARLVGLGEATHGQHESFELKRALSLRLIRKHGYRLVLYEASASRARACEAYVSGASDDLAAAMKGLGMLVWNVRENAAFLRDLRAWNESAKPEQRVHFAGIDVQDGDAAAARLAALIESVDAGAAKRARELASGIDTAIQKLWGGDTSEYERSSTLAQGIVDTVDAARERLGSAAAEAHARARELQLALRMHHSLGGRDRALAELALATLDAAGTEARAVLWAHDAHVSRGTLRHLQSDELAMGGHLGAALGERYYALGFACGEGEFQALDRDPNGRDENGSWGFRRYKIAPAPAGSVEATLAAARAESFLVDLRGAPASGAISDWLSAPHGYRWAGGYNVAADFFESSKDASKLMPMIPRVDFDGLAFLARTRAAEPFDSRTPILTAR